jgi:hypothetical protein
MSNALFCEECGCVVGATARFCPGCGGAQPAAHRYPSEKEEWCVRIATAPNMPAVDLTRVASVVGQELGSDVSMSTGDSVIFAYTASELAASRAADAFEQVPEGAEGSLTISISRWSSRGEEWLTQGTEEAPRVTEPARPAAVRGRSFTLEFYVDRSAPEFLSDFVSGNSPQLAPMGYRITSQSIGGVTLTRRYLPFWVGLLGVLTIPLGLVGLAVLFYYRRTALISLTFVPADDGTHVLISGEASHQIQRYFRELAALYE